MFLVSAVHIPFQVFFLISRDNNLDFIFAVKSFGPADIRRQWEVHFMIGKASESELDQKELHLFSLPLLAHSDSKAHVLLEGNHAKVTQAHIEQYRNKPKRYLFRYVITLRRVETSSA